MAIYEYGCEKCGTSSELIRTYDERDDVVECTSCKDDMRRVEIAAGIGHRVDRARRMYAVMQDGRKVEGHFGKAARNKKGLGW